MNRTILKNKVLCIILALTLVAGMITAPAIMKINATETETEVAVDFKDVLTDNSWQITATNISSLEGKYYKGKVKVDGVEYEVPFEKEDYGFVIWCNFFPMINKDGKVPVSSFEISKDTILEQIYPGNPDAPEGTDTWATPLENGQKIKITNDLKVEGINGTWSKYTGEQTVTNIGLSHKLFDTANSWYLNVDDINKLTAQYYMATIKVDGKEVKVGFEKYNTENDGNGLIIWSNKFDVTVEASNAPENKVEIPEGTILEEINPNVSGWQTPVEGGQKLKVVNALSYEKKNGVWMSSDEIQKDPIYAAIDLNFVDVDDSWYFLSNEIVKNTKGKYYKAKIKVDGKNRTIVFEKESKGLVVWTGFFSMIEEDAEVPKKSLEIPAGTEFYQIDPNNTGWSTPVKNGETIIATNTLTVNKENVGWTTGKGVEPIVVTLGKSMGMYNKNTENEVYSAMIGSPDSLKNVNLTIKGTFTADGKEREGVIWLPGNGEIFFYTDGAKKTLNIIKNTDFVSVDKKTVIKFDKNYEIDLVNQIYYEQGKKPTEKKALSVEITYDRLVGTNFMFSWKMSGNKTPVASWFRTEAIIDGKTRTVLMEYTDFDHMFFIYTNCFNDVPVEKDEGYPVKTFKMKKGTKLTPITVGTWSKDITGQPYILANDIDVTKNGEVWMNTEYMKKLETVEPIEVKVKFKQILNSAAVFEVVTPDGKRIDATYGDWTTARGMIKRGVLNEKNNKYSYSSEYAAYSITGDTFYIDSLRLNELEGVQIDKNTIVYPDSSCKSDVPIKIVNQVRIVRDENDEWVLDTKFSTEQDVENVAADEQSENSSQESSNDSSSASSDDSSAIVQLGAVAELEENKKNNYLDGNIVFADETADTKKVVIDNNVIKKDNSNIAIWIIIAAVGVVVVAGCGITTGLVLRRKRKK